MSDKEWQGHQRDCSLPQKFWLVVWETLLDQDEQVKYPTAISQYELQKKMDHPSAFAATTNPDILYAHKAMKADRIPSTTPGADPPRDARDSGSARSHSTHLETSSSDRP